MQKAGPPAFLAGPVMALLAATQTGRGWEGPGARRDRPEEKAPVTMSSPGRTLKMGSSVPPGKSEPSVSATQQAKRVSLLLPNLSVLVAVPAPSHLCLAVPGSACTCSRQRGSRSFLCSGLWPHLSHTHSSSGVPRLPRDGAARPASPEVLREPFGKHLGPGTPTLTTVNDVTSVTMGPA